jgi:hypothetical protein
MGFVLGRSENTPLDLAPITGIVPVLQAERPQAETLTRADLFNEFAKHIVVTTIPQRYRTSKKTLAAPKDNGIKLPKAPRLRRLRETAFLA